MEQKEIKLYMIKINGGAGVFIKSECVKKAISKAMLERADHIHSIDVTIVCSENEIINLN